ncbi:MAG TPA: hypothetical protein VHY91_16165 [Pirellulales bacterium]|nr:hypothetical protein [Pirellulales bacterium]
MQEANEAAEEDARTFGSAEAVRAHMREYFKWPDLPQYPNDKPAPFDPDYPQLRRSGNSIMEMYPPTTWHEHAVSTLESYRVPQEIADAFVGWLEGEQSKAATGAQPAQKQATAPLELAMADGAEPQPAEEPPAGERDAVAADDNGELHWIAFERHMENEGVLVYKTIDATGVHWWRVPAKKMMFKGREVYDLRGAVEFQPTFAQSMLLEHDGVLDDNGWEIILRHYLDSFGDGADEQLLKDLGSGDIGRALKKYAYALAVNLMFGVVLGKSLKRIRSIKSPKVRKALDKIKTRLERLFERKKPDPKKVENELREITDELRDIGDKSIDAETKKIANEIADQMEAEAKQAAKDVEKLGGPAADHGPPAGKTKRTSDKAPERKLIDKSRRKHGSVIHDATAYNLTQKWKNDPATIADSVRFNQQLVDTNGKAYSEFLPDVQRVRRTADGRLLVDVYEVQSKTQNAAFMNAKKQRYKDVLGDQAGDIDWGPPSKGEKRQ